MGCCGSVSVPDQIIPDPTGPSTFYFKKAHLLGSDYKVFQTDENGPLWLLLRKTGNWYDFNSTYVLENFIRGGGPGKDDGQALASCCFETVGADYFQEVEWGTQFFGVDYVGGDFWRADDRYSQKKQWRLSTQVRFYADRARTIDAYQLLIFAEGFARRDVRFDEVREPDGRVRYDSSESVRVDIMGQRYVLRAAGTGFEIPLVLNGDLNASSRNLVWDSPLFQATVSGLFTEKSTVSTRDGNPAMDALIGFIVSMEMAPEEVKDLARRNLHWQRVYGPGGASL